MALYWWVAQRHWRMTALLGGLEQNANVYDFELTKEDMDSMDTRVYESCTWNPTLIALEQ
jgi:hypothetical protein